MMLQTWRWFGPSDPVLLDHVRQAGVEGIVSALHETYDGSAWTADAVANRKAEIEAAGFTWSVVESIPVPNAIKRDWAAAKDEVSAFKASMRAVADAGVEVICYNFMPVVDWTRTDLRFTAPNGGLALRFDPIDFAAYDLFVLQRPVPVMIMRPRYWPRPKTDTRRWRRAKSMRWNPISSRAARRRRHPHP